MNASLALYLKTETKAAHTRVEKASLLRSIFAKEFDSEAYRQLLIRWLGFYTTWDDILSDFSFQDYHYQPRTNALQADLRSVGVDLARIEPEQPSSWGPADSLEKLGCVYVIEGSSLGARIICKRLNSVLGRAGLEGTTFYQMQPYCWDQFRTWLDAEGDQRPDQHETVAAAARKIFDEIYCHMNV